MSLADNKLQLKFSLRIFRNFQNIFLKNLYQPASKYVSKVRQDFREINSNVGNTFIQLVYFKNQNQIVHKISVHD